MEAAAAACMHLPVGMKTGTKIPYRPTPYIPTAYHIFGKKRKQEKNLEKQLVAGTGTVEPFSRPF